MAGRLRSRFGSVSFHRLETGATHHRLETGATRRAISLAEMMIAVVVLGLGLIMIASLFPVSWARARQLLEFNNKSYITAAAENAVRLLARVDGRLKLDGKPLEALSFKGDQILYMQPSPPQLLFVNPNARVHAMNLQNIRFEDEQRKFVAEYPWAEDPGLDAYDEVLRCRGPDVVEYLTGKEASYFQPQIRFYERVYPPLPLRDDELEINNSPPSQHWDALLNGRRFAWAVFHKLGKDYVQLVENEDKVNGCARNGEGGEKIEKERLFTMYYVTLRRTRAAQRFARQDWNDRFTPDPFDRARAAAVRALEAKEDMVLPVPWRVQITLGEDGSIALPGAAQGIPTEVGVNVALDNKSDPLAADLGFVAQMFRRGTVFIDELSGQVYRVESRRLANEDDPDNLQAFLTLDKEILLTPEEVDDWSTNGVLDDEERLRAVWVFPPSVDRVNGGRDPGDPLVFDGAQPVVGIDVRSLTVSPSF